MASKTEGDVDALDRASWNLLWFTDKSQAQYERALRQAQLAYRLKPDKAALLTNVGVAQYRTEQFESSVQTLLKSSELNQQQRGQPFPSDLAFLAMAQHQHGQAEAARATLKRCRELMQLPQYMNLVKAKVFGTAIASRRR